MNKAAKPNQLSMVPDAPIAEAVNTQINPAVIPDDDAEFDWNTDDAVILKEQRATAVYHNRSGELVVRQKADWDQDGDTLVYVTPENCNAFIDGIAARIRNG